MNNIEVLIQFSITILALFIGYILSWFAERRSVEARKMEHLRDRQLQILLDFLIEINDFVETCQQTIESIKTSWLKIDQNEISVATKDVYLGYIHTSCNKMIILTNELTRKNRRSIAEFNILGFHRVRTLIAEECIVKLRGIKKTLDSIMLNCNNEIISDLESEFISFQQTVEDIINSGRDQLYG